MLLSSLANRETTTSAANVAVAMQALDRHEERRRQGVPTLTVLAADDEVASTLVRRWAEGTRRRLCPATGSDAAGAVARWFEVLVDSHNMIAAAVGWLARRAGEEAAGRFRFNLSARSPHEQTLLLDRVLGSSAAVPGDVACRAILEHVCRSGSTTEGLWPRLLDRFAGDRARALTGVIALAGADRLPVLHVAAGAIGGPPFATPVTEFAALASLVPTLATVVSASEPTVKAYLATAPESRTLALAREGVVWVEQGRAGVTVDETAALRNATEGVPDSNAIERPRERVDGGGVDEQRVADPARSAAERFLFERLQAHPVTAGLFELNGRLERGDNDRAVEVDLLARGPRVAIEIDGYYHFTDFDAYRRDRRKDLLLQHAGYFVVRCLADDVLSRLEEILDTIVRAVQRGRGSE